MKIAEVIVSSFVVADRLLLLTANARGDDTGLRKLLTNEVGPARVENHHGRFGLLVLMKTGKSVNERWCLTRLPGPVR